MYYISRKLNIILRRIITVIKIVVLSLFDIVKLILSPLYLLVKVIKWIFKSQGVDLFPSKRKRRRTDFQKTSKYKAWSKQNHRVCTYNNPDFEVKQGRYVKKDESFLTLESLASDVKSLHNQVNDPLGGILNIQDEHSRYIQKSSKNQISCLEDNMDMVLDKIKALEDRDKVLSTRINNQLELINDNDERIENCFNGLESSQLKYLIDILAKKVRALQLGTSDLTFLPGDDDGDNIAREEYDFHQEAKHWAKLAKEANEDNLSEPKEMEE